MKKHRRCGMLKKNKYKKIYADQNNFDKTNEFYSKSEINLKIVILFIN